MSRFSCTYTHISHHLLFGPDLIISWFWIPIWQNVPHFPNVYIMLYCFISLFVLDTNQRVKSTISEKIQKIWLDPTSSIFSINKSIHFALLFYSFSFKLSSNAWFNVKPFSLIKTQKILIHSQDFFNKDGSGTWCIPRTPETRIRDVYLANPSSRHHPIYPLCFLKHSFKSFSNVHQYLI
jgi:hypothetical protein